MPIVGLSQRWPSTTSRFFSLVCLSWCRSYCCWSFSDRRRRRRRRQREYVYKYSGRQHFYHVQQYRVVWQLCAEHEHARARARSFVWCALHTTPYTRLCTTMFDDDSGPTARRVHIFVRLNIVTDRQLQFCRRRKCQLARVHRLLRCDLSFCPFLRVWMKMLAHCIASVESNYIAFGSEASEIQMKWNEIKSRWRLHLHI